MTTGKIGKVKDSAGKLRYYVYPIESRAGFMDLVKFVGQEFDCQLDPLDEGPGTIVQKAVVSGEEIVFVLGDTTGAQFYAQSEQGAVVAEQLASAIENRLREVM